MRIGVIFPDESSFYLGMGKDIYENYSDVRKLFKKSKQYAGFDLKRTLIYGKDSVNWNSERRSIAVLITSVALYNTWRSKTKVDAEVFFGSGVGILSALVCAGTLSLRFVVSMLRKRKMRRPLFIGTYGSVFDARNERLMTDRSTLNFECAKNPFDENVFAGVTRCAADSELDAVLEMGPGNSVTRQLSALSTGAGTIYSYLDNPDDSSFGIENLEFGKLYNYFYASKKLLGIAACTQSFVESQDENAEVEALYSEMLARVSPARVKQLAGENHGFDEGDFFEVAQRLNKILHIKRTPRNETAEYLLALQNETALNMSKYFKEWF